MLVDGGTGAPHFDATVYAINSFRRKSAATMEQALRGVMLLEAFCVLHGIDLRHRIRSGEFLALHEVNALVAVAARPSRAKPDPSPAAPADPDCGAPSIRPPSAPTPARLMRTLRNARKVATVDRNTTAIRLGYLIDYLEWLIPRQKTQAATSGGDVGATFEGDRANLLKRLRVRVPATRRRARVAPSPAQRELLLRVVAPSHPDNPWREGFTREMMRCLVLWALKTGMRRGELLALRLRNISLQLGHVEVVRSQDDRSDPRPRQPVAKTQGRLIDLDRDLIDATEGYLAARRRTPGASRHGFLFVNAKGQPLPLSSVTQAFRTLRHRHPGVGGVTCHVFRHMWNEDFSDLAMRSGMSPEEERRIRDEIMGWAPGGRIADGYQKRRTAVAARAASLSLQRKVIESGGNSEPVE